MFIEKRVIESMYRMNWGIIHLFGRLYLTKKYSPATKGIKGKIWIIGIVKGSER